MRQKAAKLLDSVDALTLRERLFVLAAVLVAVGGLWEALLAGPLEAREAAASAQVEAARARLQQLNESLELAADGIGAGMPEHLERMRALEARVAEREEAIRVYTSDLVDPAQMRFVLEDLIRRHAGVELVRAANLDAQPLFEADPREDGKPGEPAAAEGAAYPRSRAPRLYRHALVLELEGGYLDALDYLRAVERLPWRLYWGRFELDASAHPRNRIVIELHTLSLDEEWIGV